MSSTKKKLIRSCSIWRALELFGDKPTLLILESYWLGDRRFGDFQRRSGLLKTVVSNRLQKLVSDGCFRKVEYQRSPKRFEYHGTEKLRAIYPIALTMLFWERKWNRRKNKLNIELVHETSTDTALFNAQHSDVLLVDLIHHGDRRIQRTMRHQCQWLCRAASSALISASSSSSRPLPKVFQMSNAASSEFSSSP